MQIFSQLKNKHKHLFIFSDFNKKHTYEFSILLHANKYFLNVTMGL